MNFKKDGFTWASYLLGLVFIFSLLFSFLVYCWSTKEFKQLYLWHSNSSGGRYCVYQNVENAVDLQVFCTTNPDEVLRVYERLKK